MPTIAIRLQPQRLSNPDADIRYRLPELCVTRSDGIISDEGYDYVGEEDYLVVYLKTGKLTHALACVIDVVENVRLLENDLRPATVVAVQRKGNFEVVYPIHFTGEFLPE